jgi:glycosyltransferase involved in cell wall biosynthesis
MKALFIADVPLENPTSGSEQVLYHQATGLARRGAEVCAITRQADPPPWIIREVSGVREASYSASAQDMLGACISLWRYPLRFYRDLSEGSPFQVAIAHQPFNCSLLVARGMLKHVPILYVFHSPSHEEYLLSHRKNYSLRMLPHVTGRRMLERLCLRRAATVMVLSKYMKGKVKGIHRISDDKIVVNPGGVELGRFRQPGDRGALKARLGLPEGKIHLLTVRNLEPRMGIENLLMGVHILREQRADIHLILGGEGVERSNLMNMIRELHLIDEVTMTGFIPSDMLPQYYGAADFFILPTEHLEGFGLVTPESMACGTPVLGTPVGGTREILSGFEPRFLFDSNTAKAMADGIREVLSGYVPFGKEYDELRTRCREYAVTNYSWERHVSQLKSSIDEIT